MLSRLIVALCLFFSALSQGFGATALPQTGSLVTRWSADDITGVSDNTKISSWVDGIGGADATQGTSGLQPTYKTNRLGGKPSVQFPGTAVLQAGRPTALVNAIDSQNYSVMIVFRTLGSVANGSLFAASAGGANTPYWQANGTTVGRFTSGGLTLAPHAGQTSFTSIASTSSKPGTMTAAVNGSERLAVNGGVVTSNTAAIGTSGGQNVAIGAVNSGSFKGNVEIFDILVWSVELTPVQLTQAHMWACEKYSQAYPLASVPSMMVCVGDSLTAGEKGGGVSGCYPYKLAASLGLSYGQWHNLGIGGSTPTQHGTYAATEVDGLAALTGKYVKLLYFEWYNQRTAHPTPFNNTAAYADARRAIPKTLLVLGTSTDTSATTDANRAAYNSAWDSGHAAHSDAYVAIHADTQIGIETADADDPTHVLFDADGIHLVGGGYTVLAGLYETGYDALPVVYSVSGGAASVASGGTTPAFTVSLSNAAEAADTITLTSSAGTITVTASGATITNNGTGAVQVEMPAGMFEFTFTYTGAASGNQTVAFTNGQSWSNPANTQIQVNSTVRPGLNGGGFFGPGRFNFLPEDSPLDLTWRARQTTGTERTSRVYGMGL